MAKDLYVKARLTGGTITAPAVLSGPLRAQAGLGQTVKEYVHDSDYEGPYTVTPSETAQTLETEGLRMTDNVTVEGIPDTYVGSGVPVQGMADLTVEGAMVWTPAGYYPGRVGKTVAVARDLPNPTITVDSDGLITATETISSGAYYDAGRTSSRTKQLSRQAGKTVTPSDVEQTAVEAGKFTTGPVLVGPIPSNYVIVTITDEANATGTTCVITTSGSTPEPAPSGNWETVFENDSVGVGSNGDSTGYVYLPDLSSVSIADESEWRITIDGHTYVGTAAYVSQVGTYGVWYKDANDTDTVLFYNPGYAWIGYMLYQDSGSISLKIEQPEAS